MADVGKMDRNLALEAVRVTEAAALAAGFLSYQLATGKLALLKVQPVQGGYDASLYGSERLSVSAADGTRVHHLWKRAGDTSITPVNVFPPIMTLGTYAVSGSGLRALTDVPRVFSQFSAGTSLVEIIDGQFMYAESLPIFLVLILAVPAVFGFTLSLAVFGCGMLVLPLLRLPVPPRLMSAAAMAELSNTISY